MAAVRSRGTLRGPNTPARAQAARWSPKASSAPRQGHTRSLKGSGTRRSGSISTLAARVKAQQLVPRGGLEAISPQRLSGLHRGTHARRALSARRAKEPSCRRRPGAALGSWAGHQPKMPSRQQTSLARQTASPSRPLPRVVGPVGAAGHRARGAPQRSGAGEGMGVARKQDAKEVVGTGRATLQQYQPRRLQVRHGRDTLQECGGQPSLAGGMAGTLGRPPSWGLRRSRRRRRPVAARRRRSKRESSPS